MAFGDSDILPAFLTDFAVPVVFNGITTQGIFDIFETRSGGTIDVMERERAVLIKTGSLPGLANESPITVDGVSYKVRDLMAQADGGMTHVFVVAP